MSLKQTTANKNITLMTSKTKDFFNILYPDNNVTGNELRNILERSTATTQCNNTINKFNTDKECWLCGQKKWNEKPTTKKDKYNNAPECEHKLPVLQAFFVIGELYWDKMKNYGDKVKSKHKKYIDKTVKQIREDLFKKEYAWSHRYCNQKKSDKVFITDSGKINNNEIEKLLGDIYENFITKKTEEGGIEIDNKPTEKKKQIFIKERLKAITEQLEGLREHYNAIFDKKSRDYWFHLLSAVSAPDWHLRVGTTKFPLENFTLNKFGDFYKKITITKDQFIIKLDDIINKVHDDLFNEIKGDLVKNIEQTAKKNSGIFSRLTKQTQIRAGRDDFIKKYKLNISEQTKNELYNLYISNDNNDNIIENLIKLIFYIKLIDEYEFSKANNIKSFINNNNLSSYINKISELNELYNAAKLLSGLKNNSLSRRNSLSPNTRKRQRSSPSNINTRKQSRSSKLSSDIYTAAYKLLLLYNRSNSNSNRSKSNSNRSKSNSNSGRITRKRARSSNSPDRQSKKRRKKNNI